MSNERSEDEILADDDSHPIAFVRRYDNVVTFDGGGAYLGMVIAAPLGADSRSLARFEEKLRFYLEGFFSEHGRRTWGTPREGKMRVYIKLHPDSSAEASSIVEEFKVLASKRGVDVLMSKS